MRRRDRPVATTFYPRGPRPRKQTFDSLDRLVPWVLLATVLMAVLLDNLGHVGSFLTGGWG
jgi:hypothetical protein